MRILLLIFLVVLVIEPIAAQPTKEPPNLTLAPDPAVKSGTLPNGMRYAIMKNDTPSNQVSLRLMINIGSYDENDSQLGYAHFVEHMAFRANGALPGNKAEADFSALGVKFGRDLNAFTTFKSTIYKIDLPSANEASLIKSLGWLRGVADGVTFKPEDVNSERGVVLAEKEARNSRAATAMLEIARFQVPGARSMARHPIGTEDSLKSLSPPQLKAFYDSWYNPSNAIIAVVGSKPIAEMEALVRNAFGGWTSRGHLPGRATRSTVLPLRKLEAFSAEATGVPSAVSACHFRPTEMPLSDWKAKLRREIETLTATSLISTRLTKMAQKADIKLLGSGFIANEDSVDVSGACLIAVPTEEQWEPALKASREEFARFLKEGATDQEFDDAIEALRGRLRLATMQAKTRQSAAIADELATDWLEGDLSLSPAQSMRAFDIAAEGMTKDAVMARLKILWPNNDPLLVVLATKPPTPTAVIKAWWDQPAQITTAGEKVDEKPKTEKAWTPIWLGKPGKVKSTVVNANPEFTRITFANGTILNFKQTKFEQSGVEVRAAFGLGRSGLAPQDRVIAELGTQLFVVGGLGTADFLAINKHYGQSGLFGFALENTRFTFTRQPIATGLSGSLEAMAAYSNDPGFRADLVDSRVPTAIDMVMRMILSDPNAAANIALDQALYPVPFRDFPLPTGFPPMKSADFERVLKTAITTSPVEVTIVGDVTKEDAIDAVASSYGALKRRIATSAQSALKFPFRTFPATLPSPLDTTHSGPGDKAALAIIIPLYVAEPARRREEYSIQLLAEILGTTLRQRVRGELGKTYAPRVAASLPDFGNQGQISIMLETNPAELDGVEREVKSVLAALSKGNINQEMLDAARQPMLAQFKAARESNAGWASAMSGSASDPQGLRDFEAIDTVYRSVTLADVNLAAKTWFSKPFALARARPKSMTSGAAK